MMTTFRRVLDLLSPRERRKGALVLTMLVAMAMLEVAGVASVMPFLAVLGDPQVIETNPGLNEIYAIGGFTSTRAFLFFLGLVAFVMILVTALCRIASKFAMDRFTEMRRHSIGVRLLETYLRQPYAFFLGRHSGDMSKSILSEVDQLVLQVLNPGLKMIAYALTVIGLTCFALAVDPMLGVTLGVFIGGSYALVYMAVRGFLRRIGEDRAVANRERFTEAGEALGGIKAIKLRGLERAYLQRFIEPSRRFSRHQAINVSLSSVPRFLIEALGVGSVLALALYLLAREGGVEGMLPVLGGYVFAGYRILPAAQQVYAGFAKLRFGLGAVDEVYRDLQLRHTALGLSTPSRPWTPRKHVVLDGVSFVYAGSRTPAVSQITLELAVGETLGIVGGTGAGKTTLVDLLLGLLEPSEGVIRIDGQRLTMDSLRAWQASLGYVPQGIFLADASVAENIALGVPSGDIDHDAVRRAADQAQLHEFVATELPEGYRTLVGERGVRLSGGQRQRIGIARALYHDPAIVILDEATSALDNATEAAVMSAVGALREIKTIVVIAHRLSTVTHCDRIMVLDHGRVDAIGKYEQLLEENLEFRRLASSTAPEGRPAQVLSEGG